MRAPAVDGKANDAVLTVLAGAFGVRRSELTIVSGHRSRDKAVELAGDTDAHRARLEVLLVGGA